MSIQEFQNMCHGSRKTCRILNSTGQLISKGLLQENEWKNFHLTTMILQVGLFWKNLKTTKRHLEIKWPLLHSRTSVSTLSHRIRDGNSSENSIPRGIEESRNGKSTFLGDRGRWYLFLGVLGNFEEWFTPKITINSENPPQKIHINLKKKINYKFSTDFTLQSWVIMQKIDRYSRNRNKNRKISTNFWKFSDIFSLFSYLSAQKGNSVFSRSSSNFAEDSRGAEEW